MASRGDESEHLWYFAYGSNMQAATFRKRRGLEPVRVEVGQLRNYGLRFNLPIGPGERGVANVEPATGETVWGVLYLLTGAQFDFLDRTEGVGGGFYRRASVPVVGFDGTVYPAFTYTSDRGVDGRKSSPRYMGLILDGAREHGLPADYVRILEALELAVDEREDSSA